MQRLIQGPSQNMEIEVELGCFGRALLEPALDIGLR